ncbi:MAG: TonB family protein [Chitinophagales bacterium]|nr:TonB family protein [Chitinophagales bacterium]MDW8428293.1 TonB family protein [Chitinophagales bacterium]
MAVPYNPFNFLKHEADINPAFEQQNAAVERRARWYGLMLALLIHGIILVIFLYIIIRPPYPPLSASGVFLNLGLVDIGMGEVQPQGTAEQLRAPVATATPPAAVKANPQPVLTQETEEAPVWAEKKNNKPKTTAAESKNPTATAQTEGSAAPVPPKPKALYPGNQQVASTGEGTGTQAGDQGRPHGSPLGTDYTGQAGLGGIGAGGSGGGPQLGMSGRRIIYYPPIEDESQKTGRVVVNIKVDRAGNVIYAKATQRGSTTTDAYLFRLAEEAAMKTRINPDPDAAEEQFGTITYTFRLK